MKGLKEVADFIRENDNINIICHYDADGLAAGGIAKKLLERMNKQHTVTVVKGLDPDRLEKIAVMEGVFLFVDLGSSSLETIEKYLEKRKYAIVDHHKPTKETIMPHFNPHLSGFDGVRELSGSGAIYLIAKEINEKNKDLAAIAIVGAVGDMQDKEGKLIGLNRGILKDGEEAGVIKAKKDIRLYGRYTRPLLQFLSFSMDPVFPGLTANEQACYQFLTHLGIESKKDDGWVNYYQLNDDEKKKLISALYIYAKQMNISEDSLSSLIGEVYELEKEADGVLKDAKEFATLLNACGRNEKGLLGLLVCAGDRGENFEKSIKLLKQHRKNLRNGIEFIQEQGFETREFIYLIDGKGVIKDTIIGIVAGMLYGAQIVKQNKPVIAVSIDNEGMMKISGRGNFYLVRKGLDLGKAMKIAEEFGGAGGGHNVAAGARIKPEFKEDFLKKLEEMIKQQIS